MCSFSAGFSDVSVCLFKWVVFEIRSGTDTVVNSGFLSGVPLLSETITYVRVCVLQSNNCGSTTCQSGGSTLNSLFD